MKRGKQEDKTSEKEINEMENGEKMKEREYSEMREKIQE